MADNTLALIGELISQNRFDEAYVILASHCEKQPQDPILEFKAGWLCYQLGKYSDAERHLKSSLSAQIANGDAHYYLGLTLLKESRPQEAMPEFREACELKPQFAVGHLHWGISLAKTQSLRGALGQFKQALTFNPNLAAASYYSGSICLELGNQEEAIQFFEDACNSDSSMYCAFISAATTYLSLGNPSKACDVLACAVNIVSNDFLLHRIWAIALLKLNKNQEALKHFQEALNYNSKSLKALDRATLYNDWAVNLFKLNLIEDACEKLLQSIQVDPTLMPAKFNLGLAQGALGEHEKALSVLESTKTNDLNSVNFYGGINYLMLGEFEKAHEMLTAVSGSDFPALDFFKGYAYFSNEMYEPAKNHFLRACQNNTTSYLAYDALGCIANQVGSYDEAIEHFIQCTRLNPSYAIAHLHLAQSFLILNKQDAAAQELQKAINLDPDCLINQKNLIEKLIRSGQLSSAFDLSEAYAALLPFDYDFAIYKAKILKLEEKLDDALKILEEIINSQNQTGSNSVKQPGLAHMLAGQVYLSQLRAAEADYMFRAAANLYDGDASLFYFWGKTLSLLGLHEFACEKYEQASKLDPYDTDTYQAWALTLKTLGKFAEAAEVYKMASEYV